MTAVVTEDEGGNLGVLQDIFGLTPAPGPVALICGSRKWPNGETGEAIVKATIAWRLSKFPKNAVILHGDAHGVDKWTDEIARGFGFKVIRVPADWAKYGKRAGLIRNVKMLDEHRPVIVVAVWNGKSTGTLHTLNEANKRSITTEILDPFRLD